MKKIKIIDLLNKIANGEEVPTKFTYKSFLWEYDIRSKMWFTYYQKDGETLNHRLDRLFFLNLCLNDEVEVVEKVTLDGENDLISLIPHKHFCFVNYDPDKRDIVERIYKNEKKINEIIKKVNKF